VIEPQSCPAQDELEEVTPIAEFNGTILYRCPPVLQVSPWAAKGAQIGFRPSVILSATLAQSEGIEEGGLATIDGQVVRVTLDANLKGHIAMSALGERGYRFKTVSVASAQSSTTN
ncbi:MAG: hypothetical protein K6347_04305, partial [Campylobacterales bacterium]